MRKRRIKNQTTWPPTADAPTKTATRGRTINRNVKSTRVNPGTRNEGDDKDRKIRAGARVVNIINKTHIFSASRKKKPLAHQTRAAHITEEESHTERERVPCGRKRVFARRYAFPSQKRYTCHKAHTRFFFLFFVIMSRRMLSSGRQLNPIFFFFVAGPSIVHFGPHESGDVSSLSRGSGVWIHSCERKSARERRKKSNEYLPQRHEFALKELHNARTLLRYIYIEREHIHKHERAHT